MIAAVMAGPTLVEQASPGTVDGRWWRRETQVGVGGRGGPATAGRALEETLLQEERLVDLLDGLGLLADRHGQRGEPHGTTGKMATQCPEDGPVDLVQASLVDLEQGQCVTRHGQTHGAVGPHLGVVPDPLQQAVGDTRRTPGSARDLGRRAPSPGYAAYRQPPAEAGPGLRRGAGRRHRESGRGA